MPAVPATIPDSTSEPPRKPRNVTAPFTPEQMKALSKFPAPPPDQSPSSGVYLGHYERAKSRGASQPSFNVSPAQSAEPQSSFTPMGSRAPVPSHTNRQQDLPSASSDSFGASGLSGIPTPASSTVISRKPLPSTLSNVSVAAGPKKSLAPTYSAVISRKPVPTASVDTFGRSHSSKNLAPSLSAVVSGNPLPSTSSNVFGAPNPSKNIESTSSAMVSGHHMPPSSSNVLRTHGQSNTFAPTFSAGVSRNPLPSTSSNVPGMPHQSKRPAPGSPAVLGADSVSSTFSDLFRVPGPSIPTLSAQERFRRRFQAATPDTLDVFGDPQPVRPFGLGISGIPSVEDFTISQRVVESEHVSDADSYETDSCGARSFVDDGSTNILDKHAPGDTFDQHASRNVLPRQPSSDVLSVQPSGYVLREQRLDLLRRQISSNIQIQQRAENVNRGQASSNVLDVHAPVRRLRGQTISDVYSGQAPAKKIHRQRSSQVLRGEASAQMLRQQVSSSVLSQPAGGNVLNRQPPKDLMYREASSDLLGEPAPAKVPRGKASSNVLGRQTFANRLQREATARVFDLELAADLELFARVRRRQASHVSAGQPSHQEYPQSRSYDDVASARTDSVPSQDATTRNGSHTERAAETSNAPGAGSTVRRIRDMFERSGSAQTTDITGESQVPRRRRDPHHMNPHGEDARTRRNAFAEEMDRPQAYLRPRPLGRQNANPFATSPPAIRGGDRENRNVGSVRGGINQGELRRAEFGRGYEAEELNEVDEAKKAERRRRL